MTWPFARASPCGDRHSLAARLRRAPTHCVPSHALSAPSAVEASIGRVYVHSSRYPVGEIAGLDAVRVIGQEHRAAEHGRLHLALPKCQAALWQALRVRGGRHLTTMGDCSEGRPYRALGYLVSSHQYRAEQLQTWVPQLVTSSSPRSPCSTGTNAGSGADRACIYAGRVPSGLRRLRAPGSAAGCGAARRA